MVAFAAGVVTVGALDRFVLPLRLRCVDRPICAVPGAMYPHGVMDERETMNVGLGRTSLVVAASDGPGG